MLEYAARHTDLDVIAITGHDVIDGALPERWTWPTLRHSGGARHRDQHTGRRSTRAVDHQVIPRPAHAGNRRQGAPAGRAVHRAPSGPALELGAGMRVLARLMHHPNVADVVVGAEAWRRHPRLSANRLRSRD
ncbi:MAG: hypothetical protein R2854_15565 [Caldilineaceae bacterium]